MKSIASFRNSVSKSVLAVSLLEFPITCETRPRYQVIINFADHEIKLYEFFYLDSARALFESSVQESFRL